MYASLSCFLVRAACAAIGFSVAAGALLSASESAAHPMMITIGGTAQDGGKVEVEDPTGTKFYPTIAKGDDSEAVATAFKNALKNLEALAVVTSTTSTTEGGLVLTEITITPTGIENFTKPKITKTPPFSGGIGVKLVENRPTRTTIELFPDGDAPLDAIVEWQLSVFRSGVGFVGQTAVVALANSAAEDEVLTPLFDDLAALGFVVALTDGKLVFDSPLNDTLLLSQSGPARLLPAIDNAFLAEPSSLALVALGAVGLFAVARRHAAAPTRAGYGGPGRRDQGLYRAVGRERRIR